MATNKPLSDLDFLQALIDEPEPAKATRTRKPKDTRDMESWFRLDTTYYCWDCKSRNTSFADGKCLDCGSSALQVGGECSQGEDCLSFLQDHPTAKKGFRRVTAIVNGTEMCRFCFLDGLHHIPDNIAV